MPCVEHRLISAVFIQRVEIGREIRLCCCDRGFTSPFCTAFFFLLLLSPSPFFPSPFFPLPLVRTVFFNAIKTHAHAHARTHSHTSTHACFHSHTPYTHTHTHTHTHTDTHTHTHTHIFSPKTDFSFAGQ